jgi:hypothetical protein
MQPLGKNTKFCLYLKINVGKFLGLLNVWDLVMFSEVYLQNVSVADNILSGNSDEILKIVQLQK